MENIEELVDDWPGMWRVELLDWDANDPPIVHERVHLDTDEAGEIIVSRLAPFANTPINSVVVQLRTRIIARLRQDGDLMFDDAPDVRFFVKDEHGKRWMMTTGPALTPEQEMDAARTVQDIMDGLD